MRDVFINCALRVNAERDEGLVVVGEGRRVVQAMLVKVRTARSTAHGRAAQEPLCPARSVEIRREHTVQR